MAAKAQIELDAEDVETIENALGTSMAFIQSKMAFIKKDKFWKAMKDEYYQQKPLLAYFRNLRKALKQTR